jgi:hypothetical protein
MKNIKDMQIITTFILFLMLAGLCLIIYVYLSNKIVLLRKQIMLLTNQNSDLKNKLNKIILEQSLEKHNNIIPNLLLENPELKDFNEEL